MLTRPFFSFLDKLDGCVTFSAGSVLFSQVSWGNASFAPWSLSLCVNMYLLHASLIAGSLKF